MRRQLLAALAGLAVFTLVVYVVPRTFITASRLREREVRHLEHTADLMVDGLRLLIESDVAFTPDSFTDLVGPDEELRIEIPGQDPLVYGHLDDSEEKNSVERDLEVATLVLSRSTDRIEEQVVEAIRTVVFLGGFGVSVAVLIAMLLSRRLVRPFVALAERVDHADTDGLVASDLPRSGMPEADKLAEALERASARVQELVRREREFSANASHQMRTPLAALRLRLEDLQTWPQLDPDVHDEVGHAVAETERLSGTVQDLLDLARLGGIGSWSEVDLGEAVTEVVDSWNGLFREVGRALELVVPVHAVVVATSTRSMAQVLNVVLENAFAHGTGTVRVTVLDRPDHVAVAVGDEGRFDGPSDPAATRFRAGGSGIGLGLAHTIAGAVGARLVLVNRDPTTFELRLPRR